ncbi:hypothetical protein CONLIGDRAFT_652293 [Coniochaeta ligniaria NRRL 30616]|uniref:Uncharacterized protein n=1 Tax=Coniochaeta ligniaria NRRL 30616 TaxID=1408157 RepID=A0A1J7JV08_9PEZI|nr:hypothetical protein CONLIGDRAFT_652293 [Coniochaeta ligniaria NRRL 30616]
MAEDSGNSPTRKPSSNSAVNNPPGRSTSASLASAPSGFHPVRRSMTVDDSPQLRHRPTSSQPSFDRSFDSPLRRRSSTFSDYSLNEARRNIRDDILNPGGAGLEQPASSNWTLLPLAFALLPAVGGLFFKNGSSVVTDILLLGLAAVFLHWSVTQPWIWYHSAQEVRVREETMTEMVIEDESDAEAAAQGHPQQATDSKILDDVPEEDEKPNSPPPPHTPADVSRRSRQAALNELYAHEIMALTSCLLLPALAAYLLHAIRGQLSRPSEGLVSDYNLTIFILAAEIHPLSHLLKLLRTRTLHLQRVVNANPYKGTSPTLSQVQDMARRLAELESYAAAGFPTAAGNGTPDTGKQPAPQNSALVREVRNAIQPELDALNRAVRRYEKKATVLAFQTESRLGAIDTRLNDAISLAAAAAKNSASQGSFLGWLAERTTALAMMPVRAVLKVVALPFKAITAVLRRDKGEVVDKGPRDRRSGKGGSASRMSSSDRVPSRLSKR